MIPYSSNLVAGEDTIERTAMSMSQLGGELFPHGIKNNPRHGEDSGLTSLPYMIKNVHRRKALQRAANGA
jgi:hypothetical protein